VLLPTTLSHLDPIRLQIVKTVHGYYDGTDGSSLSELPWLSDACTLQADDLKSSLHSVLTTFRILTCSDEFLASVGSWWENDTVIL
jgi:hypothetical protein